jgi:hypothetical protein
MENAVSQLKGQVTTIEAHMQNTDLRFESYDKDFDRVVRSQSDAYNRTLNFLLVLVTTIIALSAFNNWYLIRHEIKMAKNELRNELAAKIKEVTHKIEDSSKTTFNKIEDEHARKFNELEAKIYDALGRIYQEAESFDTAALWYARGLELFLDSGSPEGWVASRINVLARCLEESESIVEPKYISELYGIIEAIPGGKFKDGKERLIKALQAKITGEDSGTQSA